MASPISIAILDVGIPPGELVVPSFYFLWLWKGHAATIHGKENGLESILPQNYMVIHKFLYIFSPEMSWYLQKP